MTGPCLLWVVGSDRLRRDPRRGRCGRRRTHVSMPGARARGGRRRATSGRLREGVALPHDRVSASRDVDVVDLHGLTRSRSRVRESAADRVVLVAFRLLEQFAERRVQGQLDEVVAREQSSLLWSRSFNGRLLEPRRCPPEADRHDASGSVRICASSARRARDRRFPRPSRA